jgi:hypothetical protein
MGFLRDLFSTKAYECEVESHKWRERGRAARRVGMRNLAADCDSHSRRFSDAAGGWRRAGRSAHQAHLRATDQDTSTALRPTRTRGHWWG